MIKLIDKNTNKINFGIHDKKIDFNWQDYVLHNFWDKKICRFKQKLAFHKFHFISFINDDYVIGLALVDVAIGKNIFGYIFHKTKGLCTKWQKAILNSQIIFSNDIDFNLVEFETKQMTLLIERNIDNALVTYHFKYKNIIVIDAQIELGFSHKPLRVVNPIDFEHWSFTEKRPGLKVKKINVIFNHKNLQLTPTNTLASTDWSGGFFRRNTNWIWANGATIINNDIIGFNFATFHNNALYPENAIWFNNQREHIRDIIFQWDYKEPYKEGMTVYTSDGRIHLHFKPLGQKNDINTRLFGKVKTNFRQFIGMYTGYITIDNKKIILPKFLGLFELHKALW